MERVVVTGGGSGLGRSFCRAFAEAGAAVLAVGRRSQPLAETAALDPERITPLAADVATPEGRDSVVEWVGDERLDALIHNAGVLEPIGPLAGVRLEDWRQAQAVNVEAPLFLTQAVLGSLQSGGRVLHISSGAARRAYPGWGSYCVGKAALHMLYQALDQELVDRGIRVGSLRPGVVDTPMQELIRAQPPERFPAVQRFLDLYATGQLEDPDAVARFAVELVTRVDAERFAEREWSFPEDARQ